jgi:translation initiation factor 4A
MSDVVISHTKPALIEMSTNTHATPEIIESSDIKLYKNFDEMGLPDSLLRGIYSFGFEKPSPIQEKAIAPIAEGRNLLAQAQSGTGKTGTFTIGSMARIDPTLKAPQVLVLVPTRELALQIEKVARGLSAHLNLSVHSITGGSSVYEDIRALDRGAQFIIGTPGRTYDLIYRKAFNIKHLRVLCLDEADQMLEDRFRQQFMHILEFPFPPDMKKAFFSATMAPEVVEVADRFLENPVRILLPPENVTLDGIKQYKAVVESEKWKYELLMDLYTSLNINQSIIYVNKRQRAEWLATLMNEGGFTVSYIHADMDMNERKRRMEQFRNGTMRILISTDLLARGIDVQQVSLVINFELPVQRENYIHRIGRSGRFGRKGTAINLLLSSEVALMDDIAHNYKTNIEDLPDYLDQIVL